MGLVILINHRLSVPKQVPKAGCYLDLRDGSWKHQSRHSEANIGGEVLHLMPDRDEEDLDGSANRTQHYQKDYLSHLAPTGCLILSKGDMGRGPKQSLTFHDKEPQLEAHSSIGRCGERPLRGRQSMLLQQYINPNNEQETLTSSQILQISSRRWTSLFLSHT